jgi:23S rRNA (cytidine1920-2'-O)/16S rRNA (cytidine1409-2'-O)-methyltransferase
MSSTPERGRTRLDAELVRRGLARSRDHAAELIAAGRVRVDGRTAAKPATATTDTTNVQVVGGGGPEYVSRGGHKLAGALQAFGIDVQGLTCLDAGACTGGFTDVLLRAGARQVIAVDVGHDQLAPKIRQHPNVRAYDGVNVRDLTPDQVGGPVDLVVADLSFISLRLALPALHDLVRSGGELLLLVKPQFEVGRERLGKRGVVQDDELRAEAVRGVAKAAAERGLGVAGLVRSPLPGPSGNVEFFLRLRAGAPALSEADLAAATTGYTPSGRGVTSATGANP